MIDWDELWKKIMKDEQIKTKIENLNFLDDKSGFENNHTYNVCKDIFKDYSSLIINEDNELTVLENKLYNKFCGLKYVYSVTTRIKEIDSLIRKVILRRYKYYGKTSDGNKYKNITKDTYRNIISDLIGIRVIVRHTDEFVKFNNNLLKIFELKDDYKEGVLYEHEDVPIVAEPPVFKHPKFENSKLNKYRDVFVLEPQDSGYRSVHYILSCNNLYVELQLRTIFDDGWSECNHEFVYKCESHPYYNLLSASSNILRRISTVSNDISDVMECLYNRYYNSDHVLNSKYYFVNDEDKKQIKNLVNDIDEISNIVHQLDGTIKTVALYNKNSV